MVLLLRQGVRKDGRKLEIVDEMKGELPFLKLKSVSRALGDNEVFTEKYTQMVDAHYDFAKTSKSDSEPLLSMPPKAKAASKDKFQESRISDAACAIPRPRTRRNTRTQSSFLSSPSASTRSDRIATEFGSRTKVLRLAAMDWQKTKVKNGRKAGDKVSP